MLRPCIREQPMIEVLQLVEAAREAAQHAYCPYSGLAVGAAALWADGSLSTGANVENVSYPVSLCAERSAVSAGLLTGQRLIRRIAVWADVEGMVTPCGACRQVLREFCGDSPADLEIILAGRGGSRVMTLHELLPESFGPEFLAD